MNVLWITLVSPISFLRMPPVLPNVLFEIMWMPTMMAHVADTYTGVILT